MSEVVWPSRVRGPALALCAVFLACAPLYYNRELHDAFQLPKRALFVTVALAAAGVCLIARARRPVTVPAESLLLVTFLATAVLGLGVAVAPEQGAAPLRDFLALSCWWLLGFFLIRRDRDLAWVLGGVAVAAAVTARVGVLQSQGIHTWGAIPELRFFAETLGLGYPARPRVFETLPLSFDPPGSVAGHVNVVAETVVVGLLATLGLLATVIRRAWDVSGRPRIGLIALALALVAMLWVDAHLLLVSGSRAAWLAGGLATGLLALLAWNDLGAAHIRRRVAFIAGGALAALLVVFLCVAPYVSVTGRAGHRDATLWDRVAEAFDWSSGTEHERTVLWGNTLQMVTENPVLGVGAGNWKVEYPGYAHSIRPHPADRFSLSRQPQRAHSEALQLLAETGLLGAFTVGGFFLIALRRLARQTVSADEGAPLRRAAGAAVLAVLILSLFAFPLQLPVTGSLTFLLLGAAAGLEYVRRPQVGLGLSRPVAATIGALLLVCCLLAAFDLNGQVKASAAYWMARHDRYAARVPVKDRSAVPFTDRELLQRAHDRLDAATSREPSNYLYHLKRAQCLWDLGLGDDALSAFDRVLELHPNLVQAMLLKAELHQRIGRQADLAAAYSLIFDRAFGIMPSSPEVRFACGQHLMLMAERVPEHAAEYRINAIKFFQYAADPTVREYAPDARIALASAMLENGNALDEIVDVMTLAERDAARNGDLLARCARFYSDPRLASFSGGALFGPGGMKTQSTWRRVLQMTQGRHAEAVNETMLASWYLWRSRNRTGETPDLEPAVNQLRSHLKNDPRVLFPRYHLALLLEDLGRKGEARMEWSNLYRYVQSGGRISTFWKKKIVFEAGAASRRLVNDVPDEGR
ncbi:MAG: O-antigen ligase family protein [Planctomycetota bacterium]|nr:O-antigen ligase family protein [Planctomycetota bacterium]